jgi:hypothetical protein
LSSSSAPISSASLKPFEKYLESSFLRAVAAAARESPEVELAWAPGTRVAFAPGERVTVAVDARNVAEVACTVHAVDVMAWYWSGATQYSDGQLWFAFCFIFCDFVHPLCAVGFIKFR